MFSPTLVWAEPSSGGGICSSTPASALGPGLWPSSHSSLSFFPPWCWWSAPYWRTVTGMIQTVRLHITFIESQNKPLAVLEMQMKDIEIRILLFDEAQCVVIMD